MRDYLKFYIDGEWVEPVEARRLEVVNPATEQVAGLISIGSTADVDRAVAAARRAFAHYSQTSRADRMALLASIIAEYEKRYDDFADAVTEEMGAPITLARNVHAAMGLSHLKTALAILGTFSFEEDRGPTRIVKEPIGVCGLITPWNWPLNQIACKVAPALATGCTMVLKPSEVAPFSAQIWTEVLDAAGVPAGVFNLANGDGPGVGTAISSHPDIDMVSFTGSTRAGVEVARAAAPTVKRVAQELGGKSPNIILDDADFANAVASGVRLMMNNAGQSCNAPSRMLVPQSKLAEAITVARATAESISVGDPRGDAQMGPVVSELQWNRIQRQIQAGIGEGATLVTGGVGRPEGLDTGYFVKPTIFTDVTGDMAIVREEIFGPVLVILTYRTVDEAIAIANDTEYGLAGYVSGGDAARTRDVASRIRAGQVVINSVTREHGAPFGGYKRSGNGREWGDYGFLEYLEVKSLFGYTPA